MQVTFDDLRPGDVVCGLVKVPVSIVSVNRDKSGRWHVTYNLRDFIESKKFAKMPEDVEILRSVWR
jgi:hypothetical protein